MALVQLNNPIVWPGHTDWLNQAPGMGNVTLLDAVGEYDSVVIAAREAMSISHVGFRPGTVAGAPTADIRIETVGTDGLPTGTLWATNTNIVTGTLVSNTFVLSALTATATISMGQSFCVKIVYNSGTSLNTSGMTAGTRSNMPYQVVNTGTPTKGALTAPRSVALGSSTTSFYQVRALLPQTAAAQNSFNNTSSAMRGLRISAMPFRCRAVGIRTYPSSQVGDFNAILLDDAGNELSSTSTAYDGDYSGAAVSSVADYYFDNPVQLEPNTAYRAVIQPSSATNVNVSTVTLPDLNYRSAWPGGLVVHYTTYAGSWVDTATNQLPLLDLLVDRIDDGQGNTKMLINSGELVG